MTQQCQHDRCFPDTTCALGYLDREKCEHWVVGEGVTVDSDAEANASDIPWNSYALGTSDLSIIAGRGRPVVVGVVGAPDSGKTSLLAFLYLWLLNRGKVPGWEFAGSWTLGGWESVVRPSRWTGEVAPSFPPHTSSSGRVPGLLHLTLRNEKGIARDVLFTDAPGEWFTQWSKAPNDSNVGGARWLIQRSDVVLLLADCGALSKAETLPTARRDTRDLIERVGAVAPRVPLLFTWTKKDLEMPAAIQETLEAARSQFAPHSEVWQTTTNEPQTIADVFSRAIHLGEATHHDSLYEAGLYADPFLAFRGQYGGS